MNMNDYFYLNVMLSKDGWSDRDIERCKAAGTTIPGVLYTNNFNFVMYQLTINNINLLGDFLLNITKYSQSSKHKWHSKKCLVGIYKFHLSNTKTKLPGHQNIQIF